MLFHRLLRNCHVVAVALAVAFATLSTAQAAKAPSGIAAVSAAAPSAAKGKIILAQRGARRGGARGARRGPGEVPVAVRVGVCVAGPGEALVVVRVAGPADTVVVFAGVRVARARRGTRRGVRRGARRAYRWGRRGQQYRRGGRWYFWAPWIGSYAYFGSYDACYRRCRANGYSRPYCRDLCTW